MLTDYMATPVIHYEGPEENEAEYRKIAGAFLRKVKRCTLPTQFGIYREFLPDGTYIEVKNNSQFDANIGKFQHSHPVDVIKIIVPPSGRGEQGGKRKKLIDKKSWIDMLILDIHYVCQKEQTDQFSIQPWNVRGESQEEAHKNIYLFPGSDTEPPGEYYYFGNADHVEGYYPVLGDSVTTDQYFEKRMEGPQNVTVMFSKNIQPKYEKAEKIDFLKYSDNWQPVEATVVDMHLFETFFPYSSRGEMYSQPTGIGYPWHWNYPAFAYYTNTKTYSAAGASESATYSVNAGSCHYNAEWVKQALYGTAAQLLTPNTIPTWPIIVFSTGDEGRIWRQDDLVGLDPGESFSIDDQAISEDGSKAIYFCRRYPMPKLSSTEQDATWERYTLVVASEAGVERYVIYDNSDTNAFYRHVHPIECKIYDEYKIGLYSYYIEEGDVVDGNYENVVCTYHYGVILFGKDQIKRLTQEYAAAEQGDDNPYPQWHLFDEENADWYGHGFFELTAKTLHDDYAWQEEAGDE